MAELVDALASGASIRKDVEVRVLFWAPFISENLMKNRALCFSDYFLSTLLSTFWVLQPQALRMPEPDVQALTAPASSPLEITSPARQSTPRAIEESPCAT